MKALISPGQGNLVVEVVADDDEFEVAEPLFWQACQSGIESYRFKYENGAFFQVDVATVIPTIVSMRQARLALLQAGLLSNIQAAIDSLASPAKEAAQIEWEYSQEVHRDKELVQMLAPVLNLSDSQLDNLFITASQL